jgi:iron complex outermembrane receptor protein
LTRSRMDDLRASQGFSLSTQSEKLNETSDINNSPWSAGGGNAKLKPWISDNFDLAYEHYFDDGLGVFTVQGFYKELDTFVYQRNAVYDFSNIPHDPAFQPQMYLGYSSQPVNGEGGIVKGAEVSATLMGELFAEQLSGFGVTLSASYTESNIKTDFDNGELPGLSRNVQGATFFYENESGFSARVSANYRSEFLGELAGFDAQRNQRMVKDQTTVDAQISYEFLSGSLEGMTVSLEGINLTDEPMVTYSGTNTGRIVDFDSYGSTYAVRVNYKFF